MLLILVCLLALLLACAVLVTARAPLMDAVVVPQAMLAARRGSPMLLSPSSQYVRVGEEVWRADGSTVPVPRLNPGESQRADREGVLFSEWPSQYIPARIEPAEPEAKRLHRIPANLFMSFYTSSVQGPFFTAVANSVSKHPNYTFRFFDDVACRRMIAEKMGPDVLTAYDLLVPGAYKCDLWRLCVLYLYGGLYLDMRYGPCVNFDTLFDHDTDYFVVNDAGIGTVHNAVMACVPEHPIMRRYIIRVVAMVLSRSYGKSPLHITGPAILGEVLFEHFPHLNGRIPERITHPVLGNIKSTNFNLSAFTHETHAGRRVGVVKMPGCYNTATFYRHTNKKGYSLMWKERRVYAENKVPPT